MPRMAWWTPSVGDHMAVLPTTGQGPDGSHGLQSAGVRGWCRRQGLAGFTFLSTPFTRTVTCFRLRARSATML